MYLTDDDFTDLRMQRILQNFKSRPDFIEKHWDKLYRLGATFEGTIVHEEEHVDQFLEIERRIANKLKEGYKRESSNFADIHGEYEYYSQYNNSSKYPTGTEIPSLIDMSNTLMPHDEAEKGAVIAEWNFYITKHLTI